MNYVDEYSFSTPYINGDEYILWKGKPEKGNLITPSDVVLIPFSIFWCGFIFFWEITALQTAGSLFMAIWGLPFMAVGIYLLFGRFIWTAYMRKRTAYVITNKKIIRARGNKIDMLDGRTLPTINVEALRNGNGTVWFGELVYTRRGYRRSTHFTIENVANIAQVQQALDMMERN